MGPPAPPPAPAAPLPGGPSPGRPGALAAATALLLAVGALTATGWLDLAPLPHSPLGLLQLALGALALLLLAVALPGGEGPRAALARVLAVLLGGAPVVAYGAVAASGGLRGAVLPGLGAALALLATLALLPAPARWRRALGALLAALLVGDAVLAEAGHGLLPAAGNVLRAPCALAGVGSADPAPAAPLPEGERRGALVRTGPGDEAWTAALRGTLPEHGPVLRVLGEVETEAVERVAAGADVLTVVHRGPALRHPFDLSAYEALLLLPQSPLVRASGPESERAAAALEGFVRRGGLLLGPPPGAPWGAALARRLGAAGAAEVTGPAGARPLGLGRVVRVADRAEALAVLAQGDLRRPVGTLFDGLRDPPLPPAAFAPWRDEPQARRPAGALLTAYGLVLLLLAPLARRPLGLLGVLGGPALAATAGLLAGARPGSDLVAHAAVLDLGGPGGARVEALWVSAGERGFAGRLAWEGGGAFRDLVAGAVHGPPGRRLLEPGASGWLVRLTTATGPDPDDPEERTAGFLRALLRGPVDDARLRYARARAPLGLAAEGLPPVRPWVLSLAGGAPPAPP